MRRRTVLLCALAGLLGDSWACGGSTVCGPSNCSGCCVFATGPGSSPRGTCVGFDFQSDSSCGGGGDACTACPQGFVCSAGTCSSNQCSAKTCAGCCSFASGTTAPLGTCMGLNAESATTCGAGGAVCFACPAGAACSNGTCVSVDTDGGGPSDGGVGVGDGG